MNIGLIIRNLIIIAVILCLAFASQEPYFRKYGQSFYLEALKQAKYYYSRAEYWFKVNIYPKVGYEIEKRGEEVQKEINKQKDNFFKTIWENLKNTLADKFYKFSGTKVE